MKFPLSCLLLFTILRLEASDVLLQDDFENGFNPAWAQISPEITIVEDESAPGNHVARITKTGAKLTSLPKDVAQAAKLAEEVKQWSDYTFSFRFRVGSLETDLRKDKRHTSLLSVGFNSKPEEDNLYEKRSFWIQALRVGKRNWRIQGPKIAWYGEAGKFENVLHRAPRSWEPQADTQWHEVRVVSQNDLSIIYFDDEEIFRGEDGRVTYGGIVIGGGWDDEILHPKWIDIDDVKVVKLK